MTPAIRVEQLGKRYRLGLTHAGSVREAVGRAAQRLRRRAATPEPAERPVDGQQVESEGNFWALRDVSFEVQPGEVVGIIGKNGAGKSTLLKILSRITAPTTGRVELYGRVASLLEVGTGFHPELTGRENVFLNGTMLGMTRAEVARRFEEIVEFAGVGRFIDTPVKRYSSGMYVRLAFAVAAHLEPEILVVDEVLAVGDAEFQAKCLGKMGDVASAGRTVLFVSHNMAGVRLLTKTALLFRQGRLARSGETGVVVSEYLGESSTETQWTIRGEHRVGVSVDRQVEFISVGFVSARPLFGATDPIAFEARLRSNGYAGVVRISLTVFMTSGVPVGSGFSSTTVDVRANHTALVRVHVADHRLAPGSYRMAVSVGMGDHRSAFRDFDTVRNVLSFEVLAERSAHDTVSAWSQHWGSVRLESILVEAV